jgi:hypothetical protein
MYWDMHDQLQLRLQRLARRERRNFWICLYLIGLAPVGITGSFMWYFTRLFLEVNPGFADWLQVWPVAILAGILAGLLYFIYVKSTLARLENAGSEFLVESPEVLAIMTRLQMESTVEQLSSEQLMRTLHARGDPAASEDVNSLTWISSQAARFEKLAPAVHHTRLHVLGNLMFVWLILFVGGWLDRYDFNDDLGSYQVVFLYSIMFAFFLDGILRTPIWRYLLPEEVARRLRE